MNGEDDVRGSKASGFQVCGAASGFYGFRVSGLWRCFRVLRPQGFSAVTLLPARGRVEIYIVEYPPIHAQRYWFSVFRAETLSLAGARVEHFIHCPPNHGWL